MNLKKKKSGDYWPRLTFDKVKFHWIEIDWNYFVDEDEEEEAKEPNFEGKNLNEIRKNLDKEEENKKKKNEKKVEKKDAATNTELEEEKILEKADISDLDREEE